MTKNTTLCKLHTTLCKLHSYCMYRGVFCKIWCLKYNIKIFLRALLHILCSIWVENSYFVFLISNLRNKRSETYLNIIIMQFGKNLNLSIQFFFKIDEGVLYNSLFVWKMLVFNVIYSEKENMTDFWLLGVYITWQFRRRVHITKLWTLMSNTGQFFLNSLLTTSRVCI